MTKPIRVLSVSDFHCGNLSGLTPPKYNEQSEFNYKYYVYRRALWEWVTREIEALKPIDICVANGDLLDGKGDKVGGNDQMNVTIPVQIEMATEFLKWVGADKYYLTYGTGYHTGKEDDWETQVAQALGATIDDVLTLDVNGLLMRWRHHIGGSLVPSGRATALLRQQEWDALWSLDGEFQRSDVLVFGHTHYFQSVKNRYGTAIISPALQGLDGSQLGARRMGGIVDYGFLHFDVEDKDTWTWNAHRLIQKPSVRAGSLPSLEKSTPSPLSRLISKASKKKG